MTVTLNQPVRVGRRSIRLSWSSDLSAPVTFYVYVNGSRTVTTDRSRVFHLAYGQSLDVQVFDDADALPAKVWRDYVTLQWLRSTATVDYYRVDQFVDAAWSEIKRYSDEDLQYYQHRTGPLADDTTHQFRIVPVGVDGNEGAAISWSFLMVRRPDVPDASYTYDNVAGTFTVTV